MSFRSSHVINTNVNMRVPQNSNTQSISKSELDTDDILDMEHSFRVAVCLVLFFAYLQARPINLNELGLPFIKADVSCEHTVTFTSPSNVEPHCCAAAFGVIMEQLKQARANCTDGKRHVEYTLESLELYSSQCPQSEQRNSSHCTWDSEDDQKPLAEFVDDIETFMQHRAVIQKLH